MLVCHKQLFFLVLIAFGLCSCTSRNVSKGAYVSGIIDKCYELTEELSVFEVKGGNKESVMSLSMSYLMLGNKKQGQLFAKNSPIKGELSKGEYISITKVVDYPYGSAGRCWIVKVKSNKYPTNLLEIPSCWVWGSPIWVSPQSPSDIKSGIKLKLTSDYLKMVGAELCK